MRGNRRSFTAAAVVLMAVAGCGDSGAGDTAAAGRGPAEPSTVASAVPTTVASAAATTTPRPVATEPPTTAVSTTAPTSTAPSTAVSTTAPTTTVVETTTTAPPTTVATTTTVSTTTTTVPTTTVPAPGRAAVAIRGFAFSPATLTVKVNDVVVWTNDDSAAHTATADGGAFDSGARSGGQAFEFRATAAGTFAYHCAIHPSMKGTLIVE